MSDTESSHAQTDPYLADDDNGDDQLSNAVIRVALQSGLVPKEKASVGLQSGHAVPEPKLSVEVFEYESGASSAASSSKRPFEAKEEKSEDEEHPGCKIRREKATTMNPKPKMPPMDETAKMVEPIAEAVTNALLWSALQERNQVAPAAAMPKGSMRPPEPDRPPSWMTPTPAVRPSTFGRMPPQYGKMDRLAWNNPEHRGYFSSRREYERVVFGVYRTKDSNAAKAKAKAKGKK